jgi:hypothetical protein
MPRGHEIALAPPGKRPVWPTRQTPPIFSIGILKATLIDSGNAKSNGAAF